MEGVYLDKILSPIGAKTPETPEVKRGVIFPSKEALISALQTEWEFEGEGKFSSGGIGVRYTIDAVSKDKKLIIHIEAEPVIGSAVKVVDVKKDKIGSL